MHFKRKILDVNRPGLLFDDESGFSSGELVINCLRTGKVGKLIVETFVQPIS